VLRDHGTPLPPVDELLRPDSTQFSWDHVNKRQVTQGVRIEFSPGQLRVGAYRPFFAQHTYFDASQQLDNRTYQLPSIFPTSRSKNIGMYIVGSGPMSRFAAFMLDALPDLHVTGAGSGGQFFPRWTYEKADPDDGGLYLELGKGDVDEHGYRRVDNITDGIVAVYEQAIGAPVTKDDVFSYVYGLLHDPHSRRTHAADLRKMLPRIPTPSSRERFDRLAEAGRALAELHVNYESVSPYPLDVQLKPGADPADRETWRVAKMKWATKGDHSTIVYNPKVTITGIPEGAERYQLGSRSALGWIIDRYQRKVDKTSGIVNDPNDWCDEHDDPTYIVDLIKRGTTVAVKTIVDRLNRQADGPIG
jgi:predicted helicase